jgi:hypothetical protein
VRRAFERGYTYLSTGTPERLRFPRGVRLARQEDIPKCSDETLKRIASADIRTGFCIKSTDDPGYSAYLEANVHAESVWAVFEGLVMRLLPVVVAPLIAHKDEEPTFGPYTDKTAALSALKPHIESLQHDGFIEFGMMYQQDGITEQIFVDSSKYFKIWTNRGAEACAYLERIGVAEADHLQFIDEYPHVTERVSDLPTPMTVISAFINAFESLPDRDVTPH